MALADGQQTTEAAEPRGRKAVIIGIIVVVLLIGAVLGYRYWQYSISNISTDDAQLSGDVVQIAPEVSGKIAKVLVDDNQQVKQHQLLVVLDDETYRANVAQAQANLEAAIAQAKGAGVAVTLTDQTGLAQLTQAAGLMQQADSNIATAKDDAARAAAAVTNMEAVAHGAQSGVSSAQSALQGAVANRDRARSGIASAQAQVRTAQANAQAARANIDAAQAMADKAVKDEQRYNDLVTKGAISHQMADQAAATARSATAQLESAKRQAEAAETTVTMRQADLESARQQLDAAEAAVAQARTQISTARDQVAAATANVAQARAQRAAAEQSIHMAQARAEQAQGQQEQAHTAPVQVDASRSNQVQAQAKIAQAAAALQAAKIQLKHTRIYAPVDGQVSKKSAEVGALVQTGTPLMAVVRPDIWVVANYKETQLTGMHPGLKASVTVDSLPGRTFAGHVDSVSAATGNVFALLPADNATGNFTKVVQRIPVKIVLDISPDDMAQLRDGMRAGMSVQATITLR